MAKTIWKIIALVLATVFAAATVYAAGYTDALNIKDNYRMMNKERYRR